MTKPASPAHPTIIAAIPCHNEDRFIGSLVLKAKELVDRVVVIDDGSTDKTAHIAEAAGALVLRHDVNNGKGMAMNTAFHWAKENGVQTLVLFDGDSQHDPAHIPDVLKPVLTDETDVVVGSRFLNIRSNIPWYRAIGQRIITLVTNIDSGVKLTDTQSGFRAFSRRAIETLSFMQAELGDVECEMQFLIKEHDLRVAEVPISVSYKEKAKRNPLVQGLRNLGAVISLVSERRPLLFFSLSGLVSIIIGLVTGSTGLYSVSQGGSMTNGTVLVATLLVIIGVISVFTGIILNVLTKQSKRYE